MMADETWDFTVRQIIERARIAADTGDFHTLVLAYLLTDLTEAVRELIVEMREITQTTE